MSKLYINIYYKEQVTPNVLQPTIQFCISGCIRYAEVDSLIVK